MDGTPDVEFTVYGTPKTAGSKRSFPNPKTGKMIVTDDNKDTKSWQHAVASAAMDERLGDLLRGPLAVEFTFYRARGTGHFGSGRNAGVVKPSAPRYPITRPDALKLTRAVEDALTGVLWKDDSQIVDERIRKEYGEPERVEVRLWLLEAAVGAQEQTLLAAAA